MINKINIDDKIFHGINLEFYKEKVSDFVIFEQILKTRKIKPRKDLLLDNCPYYNNLPNIYEQDNNEICLAIHPRNKQFTYVYDSESYSTAFYHYIRFNISFIFLANILDSREYSLQYGDAGEIRLNGAINLDYQLVGIGMYDDSFNEKYYAIKNLLKRYDYSVPIVDSLSGKIIKKPYQLVKK